MSEKIVLGEITDAGEITLPLEYLKKMDISIGDKVNLKVEDFHFADPTRDYRAIVVSKA